MKRARSLQDTRPVSRRVAAALNRSTSLYGRAISMAPSKPLTMTWAASRAGPFSVISPDSWPSFEDPGKPGFVRIKELDDGLLHGLGERVVPGRKHSAQTHPALAEDVGVDRCVRADLCDGIRLVLVNGLQGRGESLRISLDQGTAELRLSREVVMQAGLGDMQLGRNVGVAEPVESTQLHQPLGDIEDAGGRISVVNLLVSRDSEFGSVPSRHSLPHWVLTLYLLVGQCSLQAN